MADTQPKRGPGRPPREKKVVAAPVNRGVIKEPDDPLNRLEMTLDNPTIFKDIFAYFKSIGTIEIHIKCTPTHMIFFALDHINTLRTMFKVDGEKISSYYCESTFTLFLLQQHAIEAFSSIASCYDNISFMQKSDLQDSLTVILRNPKNKNERSYKINLSNFTEKPELYEIEELSTPEILDTYPICFTLESKVCKKTISDLISNKNSNSVRLVKESDNPLHFESQSGAVITVDAFTNPELIKLRDKSEGGLFMVEIASKNLKTIHNAFLSENVTIYAKSDADMVFTTRVDGDILEAVTMTTLLKLKE